MPTPTPPPRLVPQRPTLQPCETLALWGDATNAQIIGELKEHLDAQLAAENDESSPVVESSPDCKTIEALRLMYAPEQTGSYSRNAQAINAIYHSKHELPWSLSLQQKLEQLWIPLFLRSTINHTDNVFLLCSGSHALAHLRKMSPTASELAENDWDCLILAHAFLNYCMYRNVRSIVHEFLVETWADVNVKLLHALKLVKTEWASLLHCRLTIDYVTSIYNRDLGSGKHEDPTRKKELIDLLQANDFYRHARLYGEVLQTAPKPFVNQIAANSRLVQDNDAYPSLWAQFQSCLDRIHNAGGVPETQRPQLKRSTRKIITYIQGDSDFEHFRAWLLETMGIADIGAWYRSTYPPSRVRKKNKERAGRGGRAD